MFSMARSSHVWNTEANVKIEQSMMWEETEYVDYRRKKKKILVWVLIFLDSKVN